MTAADPPGWRRSRYIVGETMNRTGEVRFERGAQGQITIVLLLGGVPIARSQSPANIAAEVVFRDLGYLAFSKALVVPVPTNAATLLLAAKAAPDTEEFASACELISACTW
jgi:hypothetical protein